MTREKYSSLTDHLVVKELKDTQEDRIKELEETLLHHVAPEDALNRIKELEDALRDFEGSFRIVLPSGHIEVLNPNLPEILDNARRVLEGK